MKEVLIRADRQDRLARRRVGSPARLRVGGLARRPLQTSLVVVMGAAKR